MSQSLGRVVETVDKSVTLDGAQKGALPKGKTRKDLNESIRYTDHKDTAHEGVYAVLEIFRKT